MTPTHDTAAALEAAIDDYGCAMRDDYRYGGSSAEAALDDVGRAIAAHVEAEVARRLAAAPDVEAAIDALIDAEDIDTRAVVAAEAGDKAAIVAMWTTEPIALAARTTLRAAIAADKARAVAEALSYTSSPTAEQAARDMLERMGVEDAQDFTAGDVVELANLIAEQRPRKPRPTPDESRRLVEALETAACEWGMRRNNYERDVTATARTALLRALGVEA